MAHKTFLGGLFSIFIRIFLTVYFYLNVKKIIFSEGDKNVTTVGSLDLEKQGDIQFNNARLRIFHVLRQQRPEGDKFLFDDGEIEKHITIEWVNQKADWNQDSPFTYDTYKSKICEESDFGDDEKAKELFASWKGFTLICPETKAFDNIEMLGDKGSMKSKNIVINFKRC